MKRVISIFLSLCLYLTVFSATAFAKNQITTFEITLDGFETGANKSGIKISLSDDRLEIKNQSCQGNFGDGDTILEQKKYIFAVTVSIKDGVDACFPEDIEAKNLKLPEGCITSNATVISKQNSVFVTFSLKSPKSQETIAGEEVNTHKHCYCGGFIEIGDHNTHTEIKYTPWDGKSKIVYNNKNSAFVYLTQNAERDTTFTVPGDKTLTICLNGHSIKMTGNDRVININTGGKLRLCDCQRSEKSKIYGGVNRYGGGVHVGGTFEMYGGIITENYGGYGGGVYNNNHFYLYGGDVYNNKAEYGGGVWNNNDVDTGFIMYEGTVSHNTAGFGAGVWCNDKSKSVLNGGTINNNVTAGAGGGIYVNDKATLEHNGGAIIENFARWGGGIWNNGGTLLINGGRISYNTASYASQDPLSEPDGNGGGIWNNDDGLVNMTKGEITLNRAGFGGGVWCNDGSRFVMSGGVIAENTANYGGGVFIQNQKEIPNPGRFRLMGNAGIVYNEAYQTGGGVYVKGILEIEGEAEIIINRAGSEEFAQTAIEPIGQFSYVSAHPTQFIDVPENAYYLEPVKWALENNITSGTTDITFSPDDKCTRGQVITFLYRLYGCPETDGFYFADTSPADYFYDATRWAWELKMERTTTFSPNYYCSRASAIKYMWIAAGRPEPSITHSFTDVPADADYSKAVSWGLEKGITQGTTPTTFSPSDYCTRAQVVTFLYRAFK